MVVGLEYGLNFPVFKCYIQEVDNFFVRFNSNSEVVSGEYFADFFLHFFYFWGVLIEHCQVVITVQADVDVGYLFKLREEITTNQFICFCSIVAPHGDVKECV